MTKEINAIPNSFQNFIIVSLKTIPSINITAHIDKMNKNIFSIILTLYSYIKIIASNLLTVILKTTK